MSHSASRNVRRMLHAALGYLLGAAGLIWVFHGGGLHEILPAVRGIRWGWVALAIVFDVLSYMCQAWRWQTLLRPVGNIHVLKTAQAIYAGLFTSEVLPLRLGEFVRTYLVSRWMAASVPAVFSTLLLERLLDGFWLAVCIGVTALLVPLPTVLAGGGMLLGLAVVAGGGGILYLALSRELQVAAPRRCRWQPLQRAEQALRDAARGLRLASRSWALATAAFASLLVLAGQILAFSCIVWAVDVDLTIWATAAVLLVIHLGTALPNAPGNLGTFQFFCVVGLGMFGVEKAPAAALSMIAFVLLTIPLWTIGLVSLAQAGISFGSLRHRAEQLQESVVPAAPGL